MSSIVSSSEPAGVRYHGLDALRAWAMSMGIVLHAAWILIPGDAGAPATDVSAHPFFDWLCLAIHTFRMQLFFVLAGFFACLLLRKRGVRKFIKNRFSRIVVPLVTFWLVLCPLIMWQYNSAGLRSGAIQSDSSPWGLTQDYFANITPDSTMLLHLWFLYYLSWAYVLVLAIRAVVVRIDRSGNLREHISKIFGNLVTRRWSVFALAAIFAPWIWLMKGPWGIEIGLDTLFLKWPGMLSYLLYFVVGWLIFRNVDKLETMVRSWRWQLAVGLLLTVPYYFYAKTAMEHGYATWKYPELTVEDIVFDHEHNRADYPSLRAALLAAESGTIANSLWNALPERNQQFVETHASVTDNQLTGLLTAINLSVISDNTFADSIVTRLSGLSHEASAALELASSQRTAEQSRRLNREILEAGFSNIIHTEDVNRPYYQPVRAAYAFVYSLTTWLLIFGCIGCFHSLCSHESKFWRYFSDSSYWMYLAHLPIQFQILVWFGDIPWSGVAKFSLYVLGTTAVLVPSYHFLVRPTWIGLLLNGRMLPVFGRRANAVVTADAADEPVREPSIAEVPSVASTTLM